MFMDVAWYTQGTAHCRLLGTFRIKPAIYLAFSRTTNQNATWRGHRFSSGDDRLVDRLPEWLVGSSFSRWSRVAQRDSLTRSTKNGLPVGYCLDSLERTAVDVGEGGAADRSKGPRTEGRHRTQQASLLHDGWQKRDTQLLFPTPAVEGRPRGCSEVSQLAIVFEASGWFLVSATASKPFVFVIELGTIACSKPPRVYCTSDAVTPRGHFQMLST